TFRLTADPVIANEIVMNVLGCADINVYAGRAVFVADSGGQLPSVMVSSASAASVAERKELSDLSSAFTIASELNQQISRPAAAGFEVGALARTLAYPVVPLRCRGPDDPSAFMEKVISGWRSRSVIP